VVLVCSKAVDGNTTLFTGKSLKALFPFLQVVHFHLIKYLSYFYSPEPHILLFRRPLGTDPQSGRVDPELERKAREEYTGQFGIVRK
jgi:hypothetical protein